MNRGQSVRVRFHDALKVDVSVRDWGSRNVVKLELFNLVISADHS
jgi:hypothetical protein